MNSVGSNNLWMNYQRFTLSGCKDMGIRKFKFVAKTQFLYRKQVGLKTYICIEREVDINI